MSTKNRTSLATRVIHAGHEPDPATGAVVPPLYTATTYVQDGIGKNRGYDYSRSGNPTRQRVESCLADLENAEAAFVFPSGLSAASTMLATLKPGAKIVAHEDLYGGVYRLLAQVGPAMAGYDVELVDFSDAEALRAVAQGANLMWFETPSNPLLKIVDLQAVAQIARDVGAVTVCDSTFASPCGQLPLDHGVDVVMHSATKFLGGHSDLLGGVLSVSERAPEGLAGRVGYLQNALGAVMSPSDCALLLRSLRTLALRVERQASSAAFIAEKLSQNASAYGISQVVYPGLETHRGHAIAAQQMANFGALISLRLEGGLDRVERVLTSTRLFHFAVSLGSVESLIQHPASLTHAAVAEEHREKISIGDDLIRLSVGCEDPDDLVADLDAALRTA
ncbi:PLP-dependent aspartate aminotransferase family protein [uncultured Shimia sp.]|uniref:trans-sulfuration enzyme family protein n=1 Tax=uncultured Shimia sp. TaxID=573152 RepID=UPI002629BF8A|nr:PLP-dependent aspartate aminotransferase family protein [uncultured Shimia sp.]